MESIVLWLAFLAISHIVHTWIFAFLRARRAQKNGPIASPQLPSTWPFVSIIIPAWNEKGTFERCISSLRNMDYPDWEAIIVAGGSDGTFEVAVQIASGSPNFHVVQQEPGGKNHALNQGYQSAKGEIIVLLDADSLVTPYWLHELMLKVAGGAKIVTGKMYPRKALFLHCTSKWNGFRLTR